MIKSILLHNFRAFEDLDLHLSPLTVILGPNNSGKSSILAGIRLLVQTVESFDSEVPLLLTGIMGDLGTYKDVVYGNHRGKSMKIGFSVNTTENKNPNLERFEKFQLENAINYWRSLRDNNSLDLKLSYKYRARRREIILDSSDLRLSSENNQTKVLISTKYSEDSERQIINILSGIQVPVNLKGILSKTLRMKNFLQRSLRI